MKRIKYSEIIPEEISVIKDRHEQAKWSKIGIGDIVELGNIFSSRVVYWPTIERMAKIRAEELFADFESWVEPARSVMEQDKICIRFLPKSQAERRQYITPNAATISFQPRHRGSYYGPEEGIFPLLGWNLISIPFAQDQDEFDYFLQADAPHYGKFT